MVLQCINLCIHALCVLAVQAKCGSPWNAWSCLRRVSHPIKDWQAIDGAQKTKNIIFDYIWYIIYCTKIIPGKKNTPIGLVLGTAAQFLVALFVVQGSFDSREATCGVCCWLAAGWCKILVWRCSRRHSCRVPNNPTGMNLLKCETAQKNTLFVWKRLPRQSELFFPFNWNCLAVLPWVMKVFTISVFSLRHEPADFETAKHVRPSPFALRPRGLFNLIAALWHAQIGHLELRDWVLQPEFHLDLMKFDHLRPHQTIKDLTFNCTLRGGNDDECDCRPDLLVDLVARLPLLQHLIYSLNSGLHPLKEPVQNSSCLGYDGLERLAGSLSDHKNLTHLILKDHAYEVLPMISLLGFSLEGCDAGWGWKRFESGGISDPLNMTIWGVTTYDQISDLLQMAGQGVTYDRSLSLWFSSCLKYGIWHFVWQRYISSPQKESLFRSFRNAWAFQTWCMEPQGGRGWTNETTQWGEVNPPRRTYFDYIPFLSFFLFCDPNFNAFCLEISWRTKRLGVKELFVSFARHDAFPAKLPEWILCSLGKISSKFFGCEGIKRPAYVLRNQSIDKFKEIRVEISSKLLQDAEVKSVMEREKQRFGPTLRTGIGRGGCMPGVLARKAHLCFRVQYIVTYSYYRIWQIEIEKEPGLSQKIEDHKL